MKLTSFDVIFRFRLKLNLIVRQKKETGNLNIRFAFVLKVIRAQNTYVFSLNVSLRDWSVSHRYRVLSRHSNHYQPITRKLDFSFSHRQQLRHLLKCFDARSQKLHYNETQS